MTQEEKSLLLQVLCEMFPCGVQAEGLYEEYDDNDKIIQIKTCGIITGITRSIVTIGINDDCKLDTVKPYLRPLSSATEKEMEEFEELFVGYSISQDRNCIYRSSRGDLNLGFIDWLITHQFDYRGLIPMGLALPATEGMYKF